MNDSKPVRRTPDRRILGGLRTLVALFPSALVATGATSRSAGPADRAPAMGATALNGP